MSWGQWRIIFIYRLFIVYKYYYSLGFRFHFIPNCKMQKMGLYKMARCQKIRLCRKMEKLRNSAVSIVNYFKFGEYITLIFLIVLLF